jgi:hypothetical protein
MGRESRAKGGVLTIAHAKISTGLFHEARDGRVVDVTDAREKVVFDLKIQPAEEPTLNSTASSKIHSGFDLMDGPRIFHRACVLLRQRELGLFNAMSKLKHNANNHTRKTDRQRVEEEHYPEGMDQKRYAKGQREEQRFAAYKPEQFPPFRPRHSCECDPTKDYVTKIIVEMPLDDVQSVERPQIEMLPAMKSESLLMWRQSAKDRNINICVMARDIYVSMMYDYVFPVPHVRTRAYQIHRHRRQPVDPGVI